MFGFTWHLPPILSLAITLKKLYNFYCVNVFKIYLNWCQVPNFYKKRVYKKWTASGIRLKTHKKRGKMNLKNPCELRFLCETSKLTQPDLSSNLVVSNHRKRPGFVCLFSSLWTKNSTVKIHWIDYHGVNLWLACSCQLSLLTSIREQYPWIRHGNHSLSRHSDSSVKCMFAKSYCSFMSWGWEMLPDET